MEKLALEQYLQEMQSPFESIATTAVECLITNEFLAITNEKTNFGNFGNLFQKSLEANKRANKLKYMSLKRQGQNLLVFPLSQDKLLIFCMNEATGHWHAHKLAEKHKQGILKLTKGKKKANEKQ